METGSCDKGGLESVRNARKAVWSRRDSVLGIENVDGYHFPDLRKSAKAQIDELVECLKGHVVGIIWLDIEGSWPANKEGNVKFIREMSEALGAHGHKHGVYTSETSWAAITGDWKGLADKPLWYPHWDGSESFKDYREFGGWKKPHMKQYRGNVNLCGVGTDLSWY